MPQHEQRPGSWAAGELTKEIIQVEQQWASAAKASDSAKVAPLLSEIFVEMDSDGTMQGKTDTLDRIKGAKWKIFEISDIKIALLGNVAIASGTWHGMGRLADGKAIDAREHWLDTWHKDNTWQCLSSASAAVKT